MSDLNYSSGNNGGEGASVSPEYSLVNIPAWLDSPPDEEFPALPINTRLQTLPFGELTWENFERLIKRIVSREETIADCWIYGVPGQKQFGLDILLQRMMILIILFVINASVLGIIHRMI
ncbi:hypothetical protein PGO45_03815 [Klebsiella aerogenes]